MEAVVEILKQVLLVQQQLLQMSADHLDWARFQQKNWLHSTQLPLLVAAHVTALGCTAAICCHAV
jgi:hypothetical protein